MKVSLNTVQSLIKCDLPPVDELVQRVNSQLGGVEEVIDLRPRYKDAVIVKVVSAEKHPNADKLRVCWVDDGGIVVDVDRDERGYVQVVCGAPNAATGMWAVWLPPKSTVPASFDEKELFVLSARELRGVVSNGMLASGKELAINDDHNGIIDIQPEDLPEGAPELVAGLNFGEVFGLNDVILNIENKMFTHRPDLFGQLGVAREIFAILQPESPADEQIEVSFDEPDWYWSLPVFTDASGLKLTVNNQAESVVPRFMAMALSDVEVKSSPLWMQTTLLRWGSKAINNVVDYTNYIMLLTAQPVHAYDYDKLRGQELGVRLAKQGETVKLINGKSYHLNEEDIVIIDGEGPVGLAGIMGGFDSEISASTHSVVLEVATFDMYALRRSSMRHGLFTDALTRFNKGQSHLQNDRVMKRLLDFMPGQQASPVFDLPEGAKKSAINPSIIVKPSFISERLGMNLTGDQIGNILRLVSFNVTSKSDDLDSPLEIAAPFWRTDIDEAEDLVEEIGRLYGFDRLPRELPARSMKPTPKNARKLTKQAIRNSLSRAGANEVLTYSFVHERTLKQAEQDVSQAFSLSNALSPDLQYYRLSVLPSLLDKVHMNIKAGHDEFAIFEIGKGHNKTYHASDDNGLPKEIEFIDMIYANKKTTRGAPFYKVRRMIDQLAKDLSLKVVFKPVDQSLDYPVTAPFDLERSAFVETVDGLFLGMIGELKSSVVRKFKLPTSVATATLDFDGCHQAFSQAAKTYRPLSRYPSVHQDISLKVSTEVNFSDLEAAVSQTARSEAGELTDVELGTVGIYQPEDDNSTKTVTFRLSFTSHEGTLSDKDVSAVLDQVATKVRNDHKGERK